MAHHVLGDAPGRHSGLEVAKVDLLPGEDISRLLVFSALPGGIDEGDTWPASDLVLIFSSDADQYNLIAKANISLATEGEMGPIIDGFRLQHDDGRILQIVEAPQAVECRMDWRAGNNGQCLCAGRGRTR